MSRPIVVNCKTEPYDVYIGRPGKWGNPFPMNKDRDRKTAIRLYRDYIINNKVLMNSLHELYGKKLGCFCAPKACHGDVLAELAEQQEYFYQMIGDGDHTH